MKRHDLSSFGALALAVVFSTFSAHAADWPNWRGPDHNGISTETGWNPQWPASGPKKIWSAQIGTGFSSISVANGRVYTMGNGKDSANNESDTVFCFDGKTGAKIWSYTYECELDPKYFLGGPTATPTVDGNFVYTISRKGHVFCFASDSGKIIWKTNVVDDLGLPAPVWGISGSAYIDKDLVIYNAGSCGVAFNKKNGAVAWISNKKAPGYSTAVPFTYNGAPAITFALFDTVAAVNPQTGKLLWSYPWKTQYDINAADPIVFNDKVFVSSGYNHGAALFEIKDGKPTTIWENKEMRNHFNSCVLLDGYLYGIDGEAGDKAELRCIDFATGVTKWKHPGVGSGSVTIANKTLIILSNKGELSTATPSPEGFKLISKAQVLTGQCWTVPTLANGLIYCRSNPGELICLDVK